VRLTYNSNDLTSTAAGHGWSVQASTLTRLGRIALDFSQDKTGGYPRAVTMIDGDGTAHVYSFNSSDPNPANWHYERPAGVAMDLRLDTSAGTPLDRAWSLTRPDGTRFFFEETDKAGGIQRYIVDRNGNQTEFRYNTQAGDTPLLTSIVDPDNRTTLTLTYVPGTPRLQRLADINGHRTIRFIYDTPAGDTLTELRDGGGYNPVTDTYTGLVKVFKFGYSADGRLASVKDPLNGETKLTYYGNPWAGRVQTMTDRRGKVTEFGYVDPGGIEDPAFETTVTGILVDGPTTSRFPTVYTMDPYGRTAIVKNANDQTTKLGWDNDNNVVRMEEFNGAVTTWKYDPATGYPTSSKDAEANKAGTAGSTLTYTKLAGAPGAPTVLSEKVSAQGRTWRFTYDPANGNLKTVTDPLGVATATVGDYETVYDYNAYGQLTQVHDANGNPPTVYDLFDANGYPTTITDPLGKKTTFEYGDRGEVGSVTDALGNETTAQYDDFARPTKQSTPLDSGASPPVIQTTETHYDLNDNVTSVIAPNGAATTATYNAADEQETSTLPSDGATGERKTSYTYDDLGRLSQQTAPEGNLTTSNPDDFVTRYTYDPIGQLTDTVTPFDGTSSYKTSYVYDTVGNLERVIDARKNDTADGTDFTKKMAYDLNHRTIAITDAAGYTQRTQYDRDGLPTAQFDADGNKQTTVYDARGKATQVSVPHTPTNAATVQRTTRYFYDENGNQTKVEHPRGVATTTAPEDFLEEVVYDANNRVVQRKSPFATADPTYKTPANTFFQYDAVGNLSRQSEPTSATTAATARDWSSFTWFDNGAARTSTDPWGITTGSASTCSAGRPHAP
jgi:YD repeat-containing protein